MNMKPEQLALQEFGLGINLTSLDAFCVSLMLVFGLLMHLKLIFIIHTECSLISLRTSLVSLRIDSLLLEFVALFAWSRSDEKKNAKREEYIVGQK
ncbi:hypothetical protein T10_10757 [Trichinella papuae]|uniref:Transmembrane protein n=1 Tax=Trichinella papuae TaxID=268474 RepID=A0A0V1MM40_9BILA|nr:hypothetical protein T10_10757 [Trichinella papuae]